MRTYFEAWIVLAPIFSYQESSRHPTYRNSRPTRLASLPRLKSHRPERTVDAKPRHHCLLSPPISRHCSRFHRRRPDPCIAAGPHYGLQRRRPLTESLEPPHTTVDHIPSGLKRRAAPAAWKSRTPWGEPLRRAQRRSPLRSGTLRAYRI